MSLVVQSQILTEVTPNSRCIIDHSDSQWGVSMCELKLSFWRARPWGKDAEKGLSRWDFLNRVAAVGPTLDWHQSIQIMRALRSCSYWVQKDDFVVVFDLFDGLNRTWMPASGGWGSGVRDCCQFSNCAIYEVSSFPIPAITHVGMTFP